MKGEIPEFRRCCFCLPLRRGLLAWGYFKMIADVLIILLMSYIFVITLFSLNYSTNKNYKSRMYTELTVSMIAITIFFTDFIVTIVFIVGGHKKNVKLIRIFYFLSMGMWVATFLLASYITVWILRKIFTYHNVYHNLQLDRILITLCFFFLTLAVQAYFLLLLRSEVIKLSNVGEFRFVNNAAEAECTMRCEEVIVATEVVKSDNQRDPETNLQASQMTDA